MKNLFLSLASNPMKIFRIFVNSAQRPAKRNEMKTNPESKYPQKYWPPTNLGGVRCYCWCGRTKQTLSDFSLFLFFCLCVRVRIYTTKTTVRQRNRGQVNNKTNYTIFTPKKKRRKNFFCPSPSKFFTHFFLDCNSQLKIFEFFLLYWRTSTFLKK